MTYSDIETSPSLEEHLTKEHDYLWDFSIIWSINVTLILLYIVQLVRLNYSDCSKSNRLTSYIYRSFLMNLLVTLARFTYCLFDHHVDSNRKQVTEYVLQCIFCLVNFIAIMVYMLEWNALGSMVKH